MGKAMLLLIFLEPGTLHQKALDIQYSSIESCIRYGMPSIYEDTEVSLNDWGFNLEYLVSAQCLSIDSIK